MPSEDFLGWAASVVLMVEVEVVEMGMGHSHLCGCGVDAPVGDKGPVAPGTGIEGALPRLLVNLHQEGLMKQLLVLVG